VTTDVDHSPELHALIEISRKICTEAQSDALFQTILENAVRLGDAEGGTIYFYDEPSESLIFKFVISADPEVAKRLTGMHLKKGAGIVGKVAETLKTELVADTRGDPRFAKDFDRKTGFETRSILTVPLQFYDIETQSQTLVGVLQLVNKKVGSFGETDAQELEAFGGFAASLLTRAKLFERLRRQYLGTIASLAEAVDAKDPHTHRHSARVSAYSLLLARSIGFTPAQDFDLRISSLLHDIGKIGIPDAILQKRGALNDEEFGRIKTHPAEGARILRPVHLSTEIYEGILYHHEKWAGTGYPEKRKGTQIPLFARIIAFADAFDAITSARPYKAAHDFHDARQRVLGDVGTHFDPELAIVFCGLPLEEVPIEDQKRVDLQQAPET
jgi:putative nucleotidyltransferase with HDIG domain